MIKIVISLNASWNIYNFRLNLARALKKNGYEVILVAPYDKYSEILKKEFEYYNIYMNNKGTNLIEDIKTTIEFYKLYKKIEPDIALHYTIKPNIYGTIACSLLGIKTINNIAGLGTLFIKENFTTKIAKWLYRYSQSRANRIFFQNRDDFELFVENRLVDKNRCDILPGSGVDTQKFKPIPKKRKDNIFRFLFIARMLWDKGVGEFVEASKIIKNRYKNVEFQMLGFLDINNRSAVPKKKMQEWVDKGYINYLGVTDEVQKFIKEADCVVLPSFYREGVPRVLLESASMAKPIITTNVVGCKEVIDDKINGYLCEVKNAKDLADKMEMMLNLSEKEREEMGKKGREKMINQFDESIVINRYLKEIKRLLS